MTSPYHVGELVRLSAEFRDAAEALADPDTVTLRIRFPDETTTELTGAQVTNDGVGLYHHDLEVEQTGRYDFNWSGTGAVQTAHEEAFLVRRTAFP